MEFENITSKNTSELIEYISRLEKYIKELAEHYNEISLSIVDFGELSRSILHADKIIDTTGGWKKITDENLEEICATIQHAATRIKQKIK